jgi:NDP-sugar pyrophosphorylase family protein
MTLPVAAILAGGLGTRLASVLSDRPKVLAPVDGRAFLDILLEQLAGQGVRRAVLCLGVRADQVVDHLKAHPAPLAVEVSIEPAPLGTAGALALARAQLGAGPALVMNGDTHVEFDLAEFLAAHQSGGAWGTLLSVAVPDVSRYGTLDLSDDGAVLAFREKDPAQAGPGWINAGICLMEAPLLDLIAGHNQGSLERDVLAGLAPGRLRAHRTGGRFIDIGTPDSLAVAPDVIFGRKETAR